MTLKNLFHYADKRILLERRICQGRTWPRSWRKRSRSRRRNAKPLALHCRSRWNPWEKATVPEGEAFSMQEQHTKIMPRNFQYNAICFLRGAMMRSGFYLVMRTQRVPSVFWKQRCEQKKKTKWDDGRENVSVSVWGRLQQKTQFCWGFVCLFPFIFITTFFFLRFIYSSSSSWDLSSS